MFDSLQSLLDRKVSKHILGFAIGLHRVGRGGNVMCSEWKWRSPTFSALERNAIHMMYQHRAPGNLPPDRDPGVAGSAGGGAMETAGDVGRGAGSR